MPFVPIRPDDMPRARATATELDTKGIYAETFNIVVMQDYLQKKPAVVTSFLKSLVEAEAWMKANPDEAIKVVARRSTFSMRMPAGVWLRAITRPVL